MRPKVLKPTNRKKNEYLPQLIIKVWFLIFTDKSVPQLLHYLETRFHPFRLGQVPFAVQTVLGQEVLTLLNPLCLWVYADTCEEKSLGYENFKRILHFCCHFEIPLRFLPNCSSSTGVFLLATGHRKHFKIMWETKAHVSHTLVWPHGLPARTEESLILKCPRKQAKPFFLLHCLLFPFERVPQCAGVCLEAGHGRPRKLGQPPRGNRLASCGQQMCIFRHSPHWNKMLDFTKWTETPNNKNNPQHRA